MKHTIQSTRDYSIFVPNNINRDVNKIKKLTASMRLYGWLAGFPLMVKPMIGGKYNVMEGHHRLEVGGMLGIEALYVVENQDVDIALINSAQRPWNSRDYLTSFVRRGNENYLEVDEMRQRTGLHIMQCAGLLAGEVSSGGNQADVFKEGTYEVKDRQFAEKVTTIIVAMREIIGWSSESKFVNAIARCCRVEAFSPAHFIAKAKTNRAMFRKQIDIAGYTQMFEEIYNMRTASRLPLKYLADEEMRRRNIGVKKSSN